VSTISLDERLLSPEFTANPYPVYCQLRAESPVFWSEAWKAWLITRYDDVVSTLRDHHYFSNAGRVTSLLDHLPTTAREELRPLESNFAGGLINSDPPDHTRLRALVNRAFAPRMVERIRSRVQTIVNDLLDRAQEAGRMDVIRDLAYPLPAIVIAELLGVPPEDRDHFKHWADEISSFQGTGRSTAEAALNSQNFLLKMRSYLSGLVADRRRHPREDLLSALVAAEEGGNRLSAEELLSTSVTLMIAGHETTTGLIGNGLLSLLRHPDQMRRLKDDPSLIGVAIEEFLRFESPIQKGMRRVAEDVQVRGKLFRKGQIAFVMLGAANRDPNQFPDPDRLDIAREPNRHVAFGYGIHFCVGAPLARLEGPIAIATFLDRFPKVELAADTESWRDRGIFRYLEALHVSF
jgi:hypothetical protein